MPAALVLGDECHDARAHQVELHVWMGTAVGGPFAAALPPIVANETVDQIELTFRENVALAHLGPPNDHLQHTIVCRRRTDVVEARLELTRCQMPDHNRHRISFFDKYLISGRSSSGSREAVAPPEWRQFHSLFEDSGIDERFESRAQAVWIG